MAEIISLNRGRPSDLNFDRTAQYIVDEHRRRKGERDASGKETIWKEIDRQVDMTPLPKQDVHGRPLSGTEWMPALELSWQADTLETTVADIRRLMFPLDRNWFSARSMIDEAYIRRVQDEPFLARDTEITAQTVQDDADAVVEAALRHMHVLYDFRAQWDLMNAEAVKYGAYCGRARRVKHDKFEGDFRSKAAKGRRFPILQACSIRNTYLDDREHAMLTAGQMVAPMIIQENWHGLVDIKLAGMKGNTDPETEDGGWIPKALERLETVEKDKNDIEVLEAEGDILVPTSDGGTLFLENAIVTVMIGRGGPKVVRFRWREFPFRSYITGTFHRHKVLDPYGDGPLKIGAPMHKGGTEAFNRVMQVSALNAEPPVRWDPSDWRMQAQGGPRIEPRAVWESATAIDIMEIGDPAALAGIYQALRGEYRESTGTQAPRLGGQTKSHQAAFSVASEQERGLLRTVDFANATLDGPATSWLRMEYLMTRETLKNELVYVPKFRQYVRISGTDLPDAVEFEAHGARGPLEEREDQQNRIQSLTLALQLEQAKLQIAQATGQPTRGLDIEKMQLQVLKAGGWIDPELFFAGGAGTDSAALSEPAGSAQAPGILSTNPADVTAALGTRA